MRKLVLGLGVGVAALLSASSANAQAVYFQPGSATPTSLPSNAVVVADFDGTGSAVPTGPNSGVASGPAGIGGIAAAPAFESSGNFAYVGPGGSYTISFAAAQVFTFILGSLDSGNSVTLHFASGPDKTYTGSQLLGSATGNQSSSSSNGRVTFDAQNSFGGITGATFTSTIQAFEFDNLATAAPEPATWLMMIFGFGMVGAGLRRSSPARKLSLA